MSIQPSFYAGNRSLYQVEVGQPDFPAIHKVIKITNQSSNKPFALLDETTLKNLHRYASHIRIHIRMPNIVIDNVKPVMHPTAKIFTIPSAVYSDIVFSGFQDPIAIEPETYLTYSPYTKCFTIEKDVTFIKKESPTHTCSISLIGKNISFDWSGTLSLTIIPI